MAILTSRSQASGVTLDDLIHIVITSDQSQNPAGSSYKATIGQVFDSLSSYTFTNLSVNGNLNVSGNAILNNVITNTLSATTYLGLPGDIFITGGTFDKNTETLTLERSSGSSITITGFADYFTTGTTLIGDILYFDRNDMLSAYSVSLSSFTPSEDTYVTGFTYDDANTITLSQSNGQSSGVTLNTFTGLTINGGLSATSISADTYYNLPLYTEVTYSELTSLIGSSGLTEGSYYLITDFQTIYDQPDFYVFNFDYTTYPRTPLTKTGDTEPLLVFAISNDNISIDAYQPKYPKDKIKYDWTWSFTEVNSEPAKGRITERIDEYNNRTDYDHRNVLFKRYQTYSINEKLSGYVSSYNSSTGTLVGVGTNFTSLNTNDIIFMSQVVSGQYILFGVKIQSITNNNNLITYVDPTIPLINFSSRELDIFSTTSSSYFFNHKEYYIGQSDDEDYIETTTFQLDGTTKDNYIGNYSIFNEYFILSNNVFGNHTYSNTIGDRCVNNTTGDYFYRNRILTEFYNNTLLSWFFQNNEIGNGFNNNILYGEFYNNKILNGFNKNVIFYLNNDYKYFYWNTINSSIYRNIINLEFFENNIDFGFGKNLIGTYETSPFEFSTNKLGKYFTENIINGNFKVNTIKNYFSENTIEGEFNENNIGNYFGGGSSLSEPIKNYISFGFTNNDIGDYFGYGGFGNDIGTSFTYNKIGHSFYSNVIGSNFNTNSIGDYSNNNIINSLFSYNSVGIDFYENTIGTDCFSNSIDNSFIRNVVGSQFYNNKIGDEFKDNIISDLFQYNNILSSFDSNQIGIKFLYNTIGNDFRSNQIGNTFGFNKIGNSFESNAISPLSDTFFGYPIPGYVIDSKYGNVIGDNFKNNSVGQVFINNRIGTNFQNNDIRNYFGNNNIGNFFKNNDIGINFEGVNAFFGISSGLTFYNVDGFLQMGNVIGDNFSYNVVEGEFLGNEIGDNFTFNSVGIYFRSNKIGNNFDKNIIGVLELSPGSGGLESYFGYGYVDNFDFGDKKDFGNIIGDNFSTNSISTNFLGNVIQDDFFQNQIGNYFRSNKIGNKFKNNTICPSSDAFFGYDNVGELYDDYGNVIGDNFINNTIGPYFYNNRIGNYFNQNNVSGDCYNNTIGNQAFNNQLGLQFYLNEINDYFGGNIIGSGFTENYFSSYDDIGQNTIGNDFKKNRVFGGLRNNIIGSGFTQNYIKTFIDSQNFSTSTFVYGNYNCEIFSNFTGGTRLSYYDSSDILTITGVTS